MYLLQYAQRYWVTIKITRGNEYYSLDKDKLYLAKKLVDWREVKKRKSSKRNIYNSNNVKKKPV